MTKRLSKRQLDAARRIIAGYENHVKKHGAPASYYDDNGKVKENYVFVSVKDLKELSLPG